MDLERKSLGLGTRPALIVVDMINGFTDATCPLGSECYDVVTANRQILRIMRQKNLPIFFTTVTYRNPNQARVFRNRIPALDVLTPESEWVKVDARLSRQDSDPLIEKLWASSFFGTDLSVQLSELNVDSLIVTGLTTSGCVRATVVDGLQLDYPVIVPREAVGDRNSEAHEANLFDMHAKYADVVSLDDVLEAL